MAGDDIIDESVVRIRPDLSKFHEELTAKLKKETRGVEAKVRIVADYKGWGTSVDNALKAHAKRYGPRTAKVRLVADAKGWGTSVDKALANEKTPTVKLAADKKSTEKAAKETSRVLADSIKPAFGERGGLKTALHIHERITQNLGEHLKRRRNMQESYEADRIAAQDAQLQRDRKQFRTYGEMLDHFHQKAVSFDRKQLRSHQEALDHLQGQAVSFDRKRFRTFQEYLDATREEAIKFKAKEQQDEEKKRQRAAAESLAFHEKVNNELRRIHEGASADEIRIDEETAREQARIDRVRLGDRVHNLTLIEKAQNESNRRAEQEQKRSVAARKAAFSPLLKASEANGVIDLGGRGIKPSNIPIAALVALSPALLAIASSAGLAATSIAAIGTASIGAVLGITSLVVGFSRIREVLTLREQVRKEEARSTASTAENANAERSRARAVSAGARAVRDSLRGLADARRGAREADQAAVEARNAVNDAYREAAVFVRDLREELADLALQERQDALDVAGARERLTSVNNNYWATDLEKRQAALDVQKALNSQSDTKRERVTKRKQLNKLDREGLGQSEQVLAARKRATEADRAAVDAQRNVVRAQEQVADAHAQAAEAKLADAAASTKASAASQDLAAKIAALSPAAREMYYWFERNHGMLDKLRGKMEQAVLPGFLTFLKAVTDRGRGGKGASTLDILADGAARLGSIIGRTVGRLGELSRLPWFRSGLKKINAENEKSFTLLGEAALTLVKPLHQIIEAASPLFTKFSGWLLDLSEKFAAFIDKSAKDGSLIQWFKDAGEEAGKWWRILSNVLGFLKSVFSASLPTGKDLVTRLGDLTEKLDEWAKSPEGADRIEWFFGLFKKIDYEKLRNFAIHFTTFIGALKLFTFGRKHPIVSLILLLASSDMEKAENLLAGVSTAMGKVILWAEKHPVGAAAVLAILTAAKNVKSATIGFKLLGLGGLADKIAKAFGKATTATMYVTAGVVNVAGGGIGVPGGRPGGVGGVAARVRPAMAGVAALGAGGIAAIGTAIAAAAFVGFKEFQAGSATGAQGVTPAGTSANIMKNPTIGNIARGAVQNTPMAIIGNQVAGIREFGLGGWIDKWKEQIAVFVTVAKEKLTGIIDWFKQLPGRVWELLKSFPNKMAELGGNVVGYFIVGIVKGVPFLWDKMKEITATTVEMFVKMGATILKWAKELPGNIADFFTALPKKIEVAVRGIPGLFSNMWTNIKNFFLAGVNGALGLLRSFLKGVNDVTSKFDVDIPWNIPPVVDAQAAVNFNANLLPQRGSASGRAAGGLIGGYSPHSRADNIPAMLTAEEYVQPVSAVKKYGVGMMEDIRTGRFPRFGLGGLVGTIGRAVLGDPPDSAPFINDITKGVFRKIPSLTDIVSNLVGGSFDFPGGPVPGFGKWPSSAAAVHGRDSGVWRAIVQLVNKNNIKHGSFGAYNNRRTLRGGWSWHASGRAVDFAGYNQDKLAQFFMAHKASVLELIHSTKTRDYGIKRGHEHNMGEALYRQHKNHLHVAMADGGLVNPMPKRFDTGGRLNPGYTLAYNGTGATETVRTAMQEKNLNEPRRIDKRDLALLAQYIASASAQPIVMDGRKVAEIVYGYGYLPGGV